MGFRINTNVGAMNAHMYSSKNNVELDKSLASLSSGLRINTAADDASGLSIANKLSAQSNGLGQAISNANDGIGLIQTADGALEEYTNIVNRIRTLAVAGANDTQDTNSRSYISDEMLKLQSEMDHIADETKFNGKTLLDTSDNKFSFHVGAYADETTSVTIGDMNADVVFGNTSSGVLTASNTKTQTNFETIIKSMDQALDTIAGQRSTLGAAQNQLESTVRNISVTQVNVTAAESNIRDVDFAAESANFSKRNLLAQSGSYAMSQANNVQQNVMRLLQ